MIDLEQVIEKAENIYNFYLDSNWELRFIGVNIRQAAEKKKGSCPFSIALLHNLIFIDTGNQCKSGFFEMNLSCGVYEAHGEDFSFEPLCLPVHSVGRVYFQDDTIGLARSGF